ncbi:OB-fold nucleic acid binding domain-containing protein [Nocardioides daejeonensis]|uniref:OB-fold nucleic acid binding domain-containing protein n=1 Tax=Nocardioides daejeonensis TaxID=1046556 RepID=UPI000D7459FE|nr:OB-fold nucleic acid binding domain-containing protein [Nocardioides daejeonensis]
MEEGTWRSRMSRRISDWANSSDQHARDLRRAHATSGQVSIADAPDREMVRLSGTVRSVTLRPRGGVPALEAELDDGSGVITLLWLGRRRIIGISAGRTLTVGGRIGLQDGHRVMFNPRYELRP